MSAGDSRRTFVAGAWYAILGEQVTVLLPPQARSRVAALWDLADSGAGFEDVLDGLLAGGLRDLPGFGLVGTAEGVTRVLVRGAAHATVTTPSGPVEVRAGDGSTWAERSFTDADGFVVAGEQGGEAELPAVPGLVRAGSVSYGARPGAVPEEPAAPAAPAAGAEAGADTDTDTDEPAAPVEATPSGAAAPSVASLSTEPPAQGSPVAVPAPEPVPAAGTGSVDDDRPVATPDPEAPAPAEPLEFGDGGGDETPTGEQDALPGPDDTRIGSVPEELERPAAGIPGQPQAPPVTSRPVARLVFSTGDVVDVDRAIVVGRAPEARQFGAKDNPTLVTVPSPHHEISSTHLEIRPGSGADHGMAVVTDLGSTNGTVLVQPGLPPEDLQAGIAIALIPGAILDLGDGVTIQVTNP